MSWTSEAVVLAGYKISPEAWAHAWSKYEDNYDKYPGWIEDMFVDADPATGRGPLFFGSIIHNVKEDSEPVEFDTILANAETINRAFVAFASLFEEYYKQHPEEKVPRFTKYLFCRWI